MAHILIIDDEPDVVSFIRTVLEEGGHEVSVASDGVLGVKIFQAKSPDLVLTDLYMPEQDGLETIQKLRACSSQVKVIAMSGGSPSKSGDFLLIASILGASAVLGKPFTVKLLLETVNRILATPV